MKRSKVRSEGEGSHGTTCLLYLYTSCDSDNKIVRFYVVFEKTWRYQRQTWNEQMETPCDMVGLQRW